jgi:5-methyltetrahydrofolate--homocysteine methyltransferase
MAKYPEMGPATKYVDLAETIITGDNVNSKEIAQKLIDEGVEATEILNYGLMPGMDVVGKKFKANEMYIPEVLIAARAMHAAMDVIGPLLSASDAPSRGKVVIGTVQGDLHDIGKNLVGMMLEGGGFTVIDLGVDVSPERFIEEIKKNGVKLIGLSALLTTTMTGMKTVKLAGKINTKQKNISRYETGASLPSIETLVKIAKVLKKKVGYFFGE